jgi:pSer/pThr/pTyr-binding forkhead associated (FHA) protein
MSAIVTLIIKNGALAGKAYEFDQRCRCPIGRGPDCAIRLPNNPEFQTVSRNHCLLDIDPPAIRVHDSGSRNGTWINGMQIGRPDTWHLPPETAGQPFFDYDLTEGDELKVGDTIFLVSVFVPEADRAEWTEEIATGRELCVCG